MHVSDWLLTQFDIKIDNKCYESDIQDEFIEMHVGLDAKALLICKYVSVYWSNINTVAKYLKLRAATVTFVLAFSTS